ncbi:FAD-dependent oxidoreductase [Candidatus Dependentiae bacterium]
MTKKKVVIVGSGPAGLTAGFELLKNGNFQVQLLEKDYCVGGLSKTTKYKSCKFDIGPHHFITESANIEKWWKDLMLEEEVKGNRFEELRRFTRIYYNKHFFHYPLQALNVLKGLSLFECIKCVLSYIKIRLFPIKNISSFQDWVTNKFGYRLFSIFFKTYTEKLWGISCKKISCDWAAQRIKGFSLSKAMFYAFFGKWFTKNAPRTLSDKFYYPTDGAGTLWQKVADKIQENNGLINLNSDVVGIKHKDSKITSFLAVNSKSNDFGAKKITKFKGDYFFSTMPIKNLILALDPLPNKKIVNAAKRLCYRSLITINLIVDKKDICPDHWLYIHEKEVDMVRIGNMNNFSLKMVDVKNHTALSLEYFTFFNDRLWNLSDDQLIELGKKELQKIGIVKKEKVLDGMVLREEYAYPVYIGNYKKDLNIVLNFLSKFSNLQLMGRNGLHRYNNMDIAMISAMEAVDKVLNQNLGLINVDKKKSNSVFLNKKTEKFV